MEQGAGGIEHRTGSIGPANGEKGMVDLFTGEFVCELTEFFGKLGQIKAFLFDWDGVFNSGQKFDDSGSPFSEADSMGINMLRLGYWLQRQKLPFTGIITGASNHGAEFLTEREHFDVCVQGFTNKRAPWKSILKEFDLRHEEVAFFYDDILDLPIARACGLRICVRRDGSPAFYDYIVRNGLVDYITSAVGGGGGLREATEMLGVAMSMHDEAVDVRCEYGSRYKSYLAELNLVETVYMKPV